MKILGIDNDKISNISLIIVHSVSTLTMLEISTFSQNQSKNQRENHVFEKGLSHLLSICQIQNVT